MLLKLFLFHRRFIFLLNSMGLGHLCYRLATLRQRGWKSLTTGVDSLVDNFSHFRSGLFEYALTGWMCGQLIKREICPGVARNMANAVGEWCFGVLRRLQCNAHAITQIGGGGGHSFNATMNTVAGFEQMRVGVGIFVAASLINHACEPNVAYQFSVSHLSILEQSSRSWRSSRMRRWWWRSRRWRRWWWWRRRWW